MMFPQLADGVEYWYAMGRAASLVLDWALLLIWADKKPVDRKGVLLLTVYPAITGIIIAEEYAYFVGSMELESVLPTVVYLLA